MVWEKGNRGTRGATRVEVLLEGYVREGDTAGMERACATVSLVRDRGLRVVCDPGTVSRPDILLQALEKRNLRPVDIQWVFLSHSHLDHCRYAGLFPEAYILDYWGAWEGDLCRSGVRRLSDRITAVETPGHSADSLTLMVASDTGVVAVCGDVFWDRRIDFSDPHAIDPVSLAQSRDLVLTAADFFVPGHGDIVKIDR